MKRIRGLLVACILLLSLLIAQAYTPLSIDNIWLNIIVLTSAGAIGTFLLARLLLKFTTAASTVAGVMVSACLGVSAFYFLWISEWKTQTIELQNRHFPNRVIEHQMLNPGVGSYQQRRVDKINLLPGISWTTSIHGSLDTVKWKRVDIEVNEMELKYQ